uniref:Uncharacterized protein n=1 Tax=Anguilla anguilla TaxID=7936 RepID=A0A0E9STG5_ANGAN
MTRSSLLTNKNDPCWNEERTGHGLGKLNGSKQNPTCEKNKAVHKRKATQVQMPDCSKMFKPLQSIQSCHTPS